MKLINIPKIVSICVLSSLIKLPCYTLAEQSPSPTPSSSPQAHNPVGFIHNQQQNKLPTYIKSDSLSVDSEKRVFTYRNNVEVLQGDLRLTSEELLGFYTEKNELIRLEAKRNVVITKGEEVRATGQLATYDKVADTVILTENPELLKAGSVLVADQIKVFLSTNQTEATGNVRVKLIQDPNSPNSPGLPGLGKK